MIPPDEDGPQHGLSYDRRRGRPRRGHGILAFLVLRPSWSRGALSASSIAKRPGTGSPILEAEFTVIRAALRSFIARLPSDRGA
jgi:hypothetical protein